MNFKPMIGVVGIQYQERIEKLEAELADINDGLLRMKAHWQNEKVMIQSIRKIKEEHERLNQEAQLAEREGDLAKVAEIRYGRAPFILKFIVRRTAPNVKPFNFLITDVT